MPDSDLFVWHGPAAELPADYRLEWTDADGQVHRGDDPYRFGPQIGEFDRQVFGEGRHWHAYRVLGANGRPGGFSARGGLHTKLQLLLIEGAQLSDEPDLFAKGA